MERRRGDKFVVISGEPAGVQLTVFAVCTISRHTCREMVHTAKTVKFRRLSELVRF